MQQSGALLKSPSAPLCFMLRWPTRRVRLQVGCLGAAEVFRLKCSLGWQWHRLLQVAGWDARATR